jgi:hypothetical protein
VVAGTGKITFLGESIDPDGSAIVRSKVTPRHGSQISLNYQLHVRDGS